MNKKVLNILYTLIFTLFLSLTTNAQNKCECGSGTTEVKFNWETDSFVLESDDALGVSIFNVITDVDGQPKSFTWQSATYSILSVCIKHGKTGTTTTDVALGVESGNVETPVPEGDPDYHSIDHIVFCVTDELLPVEMTSFSVILKNNLAQLEWETATEIDNYGFEVQRKSEDLEWAKVGFVKGAGNSNSPKYYSFTDQSVANSGNYLYRLKQIDIDGQYEYSDVVNITLNVNEITYKLNQNYPNPFNPSTTISYTLPEKTIVNIIVYNVYGEEVARVVEGTKEIGTHSVVFNADEIASGVYYYKLETESYVAIKKFMILK